jgi:general secretion pathway protein K
MVLGAIAVLTVMLTEFQDESAAELSSMIADRDGLKAEYIARSGLSLARLLVAAEPTIRAALMPLFMLMGARPPQIPVWEFSDRVLGAFNDADGAKEFTALANVDLAQGRNLGLEGGRFETVIIDEDAKLNINVAARGDAFSLTRVGMELLGLMTGERYNPMFEQRDRDNQYSDRTATCSAIIDWADPDENLAPCDPRTTAVASATAPEDAFYQMLEPPFRRKNAAYDSLEELHLVRGVGDDFWATFVEPEPGDPRKRVVTVWGQGAVNVNTANGQTLLAVVCASAPQAQLCIDPTQAYKFMSIVTLVRGFTMGAPLFGSPKDFIKSMQGQGMLGPFLTALGVQPVQFQSEAEAMKMVTTESKVFSVYSDGVVPGYRRETRVRLHAVVDFRNAPAPGFGPTWGAPAGSASAGVPAPAPGMPPYPGMGMPGLPGGSGVVALGATPGSAAEAIQGALAPNPAGTVIFFRIE